MKKKSRLIRTLELIKPPRIGFWLVLALFCISSVGLYLRSQKKVHQNLSINELVKKIERGEVDRIIVANSTMYSVRKGETKEAYETDIEDRMSAAQMLKTYGLTDAELKRLTITIDGFRLNFSGFLLILQAGFMMLIIGLAVLVRIKPDLISAGVGKKANTIGMKIKTRFTDVAGNVTAKKELAEMVEFLKDPSKFTRLGANIPKGALLKGPPGTGKTLLARAVAGEAGVPFFYISGSEFIELYVGVGPARVREIFKRAKKVSPSIIFIDEIDAIGGKRQAKGNNSEDDRTLNQLLTEIDGFEKDVKVIVIGATNNPDKLDEALLRRLERQIYVTLPDMKDRLAILKVMVEGKPIAEDVNLDSITRRTQGLSGDGLKSLVNEAAIRAAMAGRTTITQEDLLESIEKVLLGSADRRVVGEKEKDIIAYHEAGHAVVTAMLVSNSDVQKVTIASQGNRGGFVMNAFVEESILQSYDELINQMAIAFGGYVSEEHFIKSVSTGASDDLKKINMIARAMVTKCGMGKSFDYLTKEDDTIISEHYQQLIDADVEVILEKAHERAANTIGQNPEFVEAVHSALLEKETLEQEEFKGIAEKYQKITV